MIYKHAYLQQKWFEDVSMPYRKHVILYGTKPCKRKNCKTCQILADYIDGLVQERRNYSASAMELLIDIKFKMQIVSENNW